MPSTKQIVFLQRSGVFKLSDDLDQFGYDERQGLYYVKYKKGGKVLHYSPAKVDIAQFSRQLDPPLRVVVHCHPILNRDCHRKVNS